MLTWLRGRAPQDPAARAKEPTDIAPDELAVALTGAEPPLVLDVRTPQEYAGGHIRQAQLLPLAELGRRMGTLPQDRLIVCVCRSGNRSGFAAQQLRRNGYRARNMSGGMLRWRGPVSGGAARG